MQSAPGERTLASKPGATSAFTPAGTVKAAPILPRAVFSMASKEKGKPHMPGRGWDYAGVPKEGGDRKPALVFHSRLPPGIQTFWSKGDNRGPRGFVSIPREEADVVAGGRVACKDRVSRPSHTTFSFIRSNPLPPSGSPSVQPSTWRGTVGFSP